MVVRATAFDAPVADALLAAAQADMATRYGGPGDENPVDAAEFAPPAGCFLVAYVVGEPAGCGGWRTLAVDPTCAEVKRMYTAPGFRRRGVAQVILRALEDSSRAAGKRRVVLETGSRQPEAIALYERCGYDRITNYGYYRDHAGCVSFGREL
jgi:GNAT superfamily N-acetyltransferase